MLRDRRLLALLVAETISTTGSQMTWLALPWFVLVTTGSATRMGFVIAAAVAGVAIFGLPGGSLLARIGARRAMLVADGVRAPVMFAIPLLHWLGALSFPVLLALVFVEGAFSGPYFAAQRVVVPELLGENQELVGRANALLQGATRITLVLSPALAGLLIGPQVFVGPNNFDPVAVFGFTAGRYLVVVLWQAIGRAGRDADSDPAMAAIRQVRTMRGVWKWVGDTTGLHLQTMRAAVGWAEIGSAAEAERAAAEADALRTDHTAFTQAVHIRLGEERLRGWLYTPEAGAPEEGLTA